MSGTAAKKLLIVEDEIHLREILRFILESNNFKVLEAENGKEALEMAQKHAPDAILSDLLMPVMGGFQMLEKLREIKIDTPVIFISAFSDTDKVKRAQELGVEEFVPKPFSEEKLMQSLKNVLKIKP